LVAASQKYNIQALLIPPSFKGGDIMRKSYTYEEYQRAVEMMEKGVGDYNCI